MKRIGSKLCFCGGALIIGPFFGFTVKGFQNVNYGDGFVFGVILLIIGYFINHASSDNSDITE